MKKNRLFYARIMSSICLLLCTAVALYGQPQFEWAKKVGGYWDDYGLCVVTGPLGNVYTLGYFNGTTDFDPGPDTFNLTASSGGNLYVLKQNAQGDFEWAISFAGINAYDISSALAVDSQANVYVSGVFSGTEDFDPGPGIYNLFSGSGFSLFVAKYNTSGDLQWAVNTPGSANGKNVKDVEVDNEDGSIYVAGNYSDTIDFDPGPGTSLLYGGNGWNTFIWKLDASGNYVWAKAFDGSYNWVRGIELQGKHILIGGELSGGSVDFDPGAGTHWGYSDSGQVFACSLNSAGNFEWLNTSASGGSAYVNAFTADTAGNSYISGPYFGNPDFEPGPGVFHLSNVPNTRKNTYLTKISPEGAWLWSKDLIAGNTQLSSSASMDMDVGADGFLYVTGNFNQGDFDPGPGTAILTTANNAFDIFISKLDLSGNYQWAVGMGGPASNNNYGFSVTADASGNVYTTGRFQSSVDFDPGPASYVLNGVGKDAFIQKLSQCSLDLSVTQSGDTLWSSDPNASSYQWINCDSNNAPVAGATGPFFVPVTAGDYAVVLTQALCRDTSLCYPATGLGIPGVLYTNNKGRVFPNPCNGQCNLIMDRPLHAAQLRITDISGKVLQVRDAVSGNPVRIDISGWSSGIYFLTVEEDGVLFHAKIVR
jgi:hypothetical protein